MFLVGLLFIHKSQVWISYYSFKYFCLCLTNTELFLVLHFIQCACVNSQTESELDCNLAL